MASLAIIAVIQLFFGQIEEFFVISIASVLVNISRQYTYQNKLDLAATYFICILFIMLVILVVRGAGLRDVSMFGFIGIVIFSTMIGRPKLTILLLSFITGLCLIYGFLYEFNVIFVPEQMTNLETGLTLSIIFGVIGYATISLHRDLVSATETISEENKRVLESKAIIEHLAHHDALTNLPNRILAKDRLDHAIVKSDRYEQKVAVLFLDLDDFKSINDTLGHDSGDELLILVAQQLEMSCRKLDTICRIGGDEFLIIAEDVQDEWQVSQLAQKILKSFSGTFQLSSGPVQCTTSIGIAIAPTDGKSFEALLKKSDMAMYVAKENGRNQFHYFNNKQQEQLQYRLTLTNALKHAIQEHELVLLYQPKIDLQDQTIIGAEALLRWNSKVFGSISPTEFIPLAEQGGLIIDIGKWVIEQACRDTAKFLKLNTDFTISVNVSIAQFKKTDLASDIMAMLAQYNLDPTVLDIEITESLIADKEQDINKNLEALRHYGISISIDDFGTGYSNLGYLKKFDVETLKIDRSFIHDLIENEYNRTIVKAILQICKGLEIKAIAEGVEDKETAQLLKLWGCHSAQGFYWSKPISQSALLTLMNQGF